MEAEILPARRDRSSGSGLRRLAQIFWYGGGGIALCRTALLSNPVLPLQPGDTGEFEGVGGYHHHLAP